MSAASYSRDEAGDRGGAVLPVDTIRRCAAEIAAVSYRASRLTADDV